MADQQAINAKPDFWDEASAHLMGRDRILKKLIPRHSSEWLLPSATPFITLARAIIGQQISSKAANSVWDRFTVQCGRRPSTNSVIGVSQIGRASCRERVCQYV